MNLVFVGMDSAKVDNTEAGSSDAQKVHSTLTVNFHVIPGKAKDLFAMNPGLDYEAQFLAPGIPDVFKSVVSKYSAADLLVKRNELNQQVVAALNDKFQQYHVRVTGVNLVNFGFSKSFNDAIEEKVTETERAKTAENRLRRVQADAASKIAEAEGTARAIAIQAAAIEKQGGDKYVQLEAIKKWDGKLPTTTGGAMPFVNVGK
jgi:regulator of protease activity HflC (stomatin/prohibitin superfamily)